MRSFVTLLLAFLVSAFVGVMVQTQLAIAFDAGEEFTPILTLFLMSATLSCDHRAVDGALGAELIGAFKALIENPVMMVV